MNVTLEDFINAMMSGDKNGVSVYIEETDEASGSDHDPEYLKDVISIKIKTWYKLGVVLKDKYAKAKVVSFSALRTDAVWVAIEPYKEEQQCPASTN